MKHGWEIKKLGDVCESDLGKTLNQSKDTGELYPYLCAINIQWDKIELSTLKQTKFEASEIERYSVRKGDLLICEGGDIGRAAIWNNEEPMLYQNALHRVRFNGELIPRFCLFYLHHLKDTGILDSRYGKGVTIKHLVKSSLLSIPIPIPPLSIQERIVSELDCINGILEKKQEQIKELDALAQSIFYDMFGDPIQNEKGWEVKKLGEVAEIIGGSTPKTNDASNWNGEYFWITPAELDGRKYFYSTSRTLTDDGVKSANLQLLPIGTVLLSSRAPIGKVAITCAPMYCNQGFKNIVCSDRLNNEYVYSFLLYNNDYLNSLGTGATFKEISKRVVSEIPIPLPPLPLQQAFAAKIEAIEKQKELVKRSIAETETLLASRMQHYFEA